MEDKTTGIVLVNLGTPTAPTPKAVKQFLKEFLSDTRVVNLPKLIWQPILRGIVLQIRPKRIAKLYKNIWYPEGSPMRVICAKQAEAIGKILNQQSQNFIVRPAMRYGEPSIKNALQEFADKKINSVIVLPLFPQNSATTTAAVFDAVADFYAKQPQIPSLQFIDNYTDEEGYIAALVQSVEKHWQQHGRGNKLMMSFHGIPVRNIEQGDPYAQHCERTANAVAKKLNLTNDEWILTYQSRFGYAEWLKPYTDATLRSLAEQGIKRVDVISPAFSADCLETLEELAMTNKELFLEKGGEEYYYIPALNDDPQHCEFLAGLIRKYS